MYSAGREGHLPEVISYVNKYTLTPLPGLLFTGVLGIVFTLLNDINALLNMYMVAASFFYGLCMLALIVLRFKRKDVERAFKVSFKHYVLPSSKVMFGVRFGLWCQCSSWCSSGIAPSPLSQRFPPLSR